MRTHALKVGRGIYWYLKQVTGEAKWDEYLERARSQDMERHRSNHKENNPQARCC
jgi:hypothetical protein